MLGLYKPNGKKGGGTRNKRDAIVKNKLRKSSKLRICLCKLTDKGELVRLTKFADTRLIKEGQLIIGLRTMKIAFSSIEKDKQPSKDVEVTPKNVQEPADQTTPTTSSAQSETKNQTGKYPTLFSPNFVCLDLNDAEQNFHPSREMANEHPSVNLSSKKRRAESSSNVKIPKPKTTNRNKRNVQLQQNVATEPN